MKKFDYDFAFIHDADQVRSLAKDVLLSLENGDERDALCDMMDDIIKEGEKIGKKTGDYTKMAVGIMAVAGLGQAIMDYHRIEDNHEEG